MVVFFFPLRICQQSITNNEYPSGRKREIKRLQKMEEKSVGFVSVITIVETINRHGKYSSVHVLNFSSFFIFIRILFFSVFIFNWIEQIFVNQIDLQRDCPSAIAA